MKLTRIIDEAGYTRTRAQFENVVRLFSEFLEHEATTDDLTDDAVNGFLLHLRSQPCYIDKTVWFYRQRLLALWNKAYDLQRVRMPSMFIITRKGLTVDEDGSPRCQKFPSEVSAVAFAKGRHGKGRREAEALERWHGGPFPVCLFSASKVNEYLATLSPAAAATAWPALLDLWTAAHKRQLAQPPRPDEVKLPTGKKRKRTTRELADKLLAALDE